MRKKGLQKLLGKIDALPTSGVIEPGVDWATENRRLTREVTGGYDGPFDITMVPQVAELLAIQHPDHHVRSTTAMKSVQAAITTSWLENVLGWWLKNMLGSAAFFTSTKNMMKMKGSSSIDPLIDDGGLKDLIKPISSRNARKTGDGAMYKEFEGGCKLLMTSYLSISEMKSLFFNLLIMDEWSEAPRTISGQGSTKGVIKGRTMSTDMWKELYCSTPVNMTKCQTWKNYTEGDQRQFFVECPICGVSQHLVLRAQGRKYGLTFGRQKNRETGALELDKPSVRYTCISEKHDFHEDQKHDVANTGVWVPTWKESAFRPKGPEYRSYKLPGLISQLLGWDKVAQMFIDADFGRDYEMMITVTNNILAEPNVRVDKNFHWKKMKERAESYRLGMPPEDSGLMCYGGVDVQENRLELLVISVKRHSERYIIDYQVFYGDTKNEYDKCYSDLSSYVENTRYNIGGTDVRIVKVAMDSNWDPKTKTGKKNWKNKPHTIYQFVADNIQRFEAIAGVKTRKGVGYVKKENIVGDGIIPLKSRWDIDVNGIKHMLYDGIDKAYGANSLHVPMFEKPSGGMDINVMIPDSFYKMLVSERFQEIDSGAEAWVKIFERNEVWDCLVYAVAASHIDNMHTYVDDIAWDILEEQIRGNYG